MPRYTFEELLELSKSELVKTPEVKYEIEVIHEEGSAHTVQTGPAPIELLPVDAEASDDETHLNELANRYLLQRGSVVGKGAKKDAASINSKLVVSQVQHEQTATHRSGPVVTPAAAGFDAPAEEEGDGDGWISVEAKKPHHHKKRGGRRSFGSHYGQERFLNKSWRAGGNAVEKENNDDDEEESGAVEE